MTATLIALLEDGLSALASPEAQEYFPVFLAELTTLRAGLTPTEWRKAIEVCREHPLCGVLHADPYTRRAFEKPRGYPGDAVMLDYVYRGHREPLTEDARRIFTCTTEVSSMAASTRVRRDSFALLLDEAATRTPGLEAISIAAGHLREADRSRQLAGDAVARLVAFDADATSLATVDADYGHLGVITHEGSVIDLIRGRLTLDMFDLVYSAGLFDYLPDRTATALLRRLHSAVNSGGRLAIANFAPKCEGAAYLEAFMDWFLVYRDESDLHALADRAGIEGPVRTWTDPFGNVAYLEIERTA